MPTLYPAECGTATRLGALGMTLTECDWVAAMLLFSGNSEYCFISRNRRYSLNRTELHIKDPSMDQIDLLENHSYSIRILDIKYFYH